jgi:hypothetical protein
MALRTLSTSSLRTELARRERGATKLAKQRDTLQRRLDGILAELADLGVDGTAKRRGRPPGKRGPGRPKGIKNRKPGRPKGKRAKRMKNEMSLLEAITKGVRVGATVSPADAAAAAKKAGYRSASPNFGMMVANALAKSPAFKRTGRGQYLHKGSSKAKKGKRRTGKAVPSTAPGAAS